MIKRVKLGEKEIILIGTAHISKESVKLVEETIEAEKPDIIGVELDRERLEQLLSGKKWQETNIVEIIQAKKTELFLINILLSNMQRRLGLTMGVAPGAEMLAAVKKSSEQKVPVQLLDRDIKITLKRAFSSMGIVEKLKLGGAILASFFGMGEAITPEKIEELKKEDLLNSIMKDLGKQFPSIKKVLVDERDAHIAEMIKHSTGKKMVAVLGAGHLEGVVAHLKENKKINLNEITSVKKGANWMKIIGIAIPVAFALLLGYGFYIKGITATLSMLGYWILITGGCSAIGALIARAKPISIISAFVSAPITTLHPALAAGWISGLVEARYNPPKVKDFEMLPDVSSLSQFYKNKVTHVLIVAALTNIGATIGTIIAFPALVAFLA